MDYNAIISACDDFSAWLDEYIRELRGETETKKYTARVRTIRRKLSNNEYTSNK